MKRIVKITIDIRSYQIIRDLEIKIRGSILKKIGLKRIRGIGQIERGVKIKRDLRKNLKREILRRIKNLRQIKNLIRILE